METNKIPARADVPEKDKWAIQDLFATDDDWRAALASSFRASPHSAADWPKAVLLCCLFSVWMMKSALRLTRSYTTRSAAAMRTLASPRIRRWSAR